MNGWDFCWNNKNQIFSTKVLTFVVLLKLKYECSCISAKKAKLQKPYYSKESFKS